MKTKRILIFLLILLAFLASESSALRCGNDLVLVGNSKESVISKCGDPIIKEYWTVEETERFNIRHYKRELKQKAILNIASLICIALL